MSSILPNTQSELLAAYLHLTQDTLPYMATCSHTHWPVTADHCFQRIVLDTLFQGPWYDFIPSPAYRHLTQDTLKRAIALCHDIIEENVDLVKLNQKSIQWRKQKQLTLPFG